MERREPKGRLYGKLLLERANFAPIERKTKMSRFGQIIASGITSLGTPLLRRDFPQEGKSPFSRDRRRLYEDYLKVWKDLQKSIDTVKKENATKAYGR